MCIDPVTASLIAAGVSAATTVAGGVAANNAAKANAKQLERQAQDELAAANIAAGDQRYAAERNSGSVRAQQAASNVDIGSGSAADVGAENAANMELDALRTIYGGQVKNSALRSQAAVTRWEGRQKLNLSILAGASQLAGGAARSGVFGSSNTAPANAPSTGLQTTYRPTAPVNRI